MKYSSRNRTTSFQQCLLTLALAAAFVLTAQAYCADHDSLKVNPSSSVAAAPADTLKKSAALQAKDSAIAPATLNAPDSTRKIPMATPGDSLLKKAALQLQKKTAVAVEDTASLFLKVPSIGFGIGWALGSFDIFNDWQSSLPDSVQKILPMNPDTFGMSITEPVNTYNILFPISVSWTPLVFRKSSVSFEGSFCYIGKVLQATLEHDTTSGKVNYRQSLDSYTFNVGMLYRHSLDERFFRIEGVDRTSVIVGAYVLPYSYLSKQSSLTWSGVPDSVVVAARANLKNFYAWGYGGGWRIGITSQRALSKNSGMEVSVCYVGRYLGFFREKQGFVLNKEVNPAKADPDDKLSFFSNTVEMKVEFMIGTTNKKK
ncbi:MAG TPA: hypothetical protein VKF42_10625 [Chitinivibrionales bacterium]|nr:hypothetical protein [Chitinivibrionales bacterium]